MWRLYGRSIAALALVAAVLLAAGGGADAQGESGLFPCGPVEPCEDGNARNRLLLMPVCVCVCVCVWA